MKTMSILCSIMLAFPQYVFSKETSRSSDQQLTIEAICDSLKVAGNKLNMNVSQDLVFQESVSQIKKDNAILCFESNEPYKKQVTYMVGPKIPGQRSQHIANIHQTLKEKYGDVGVKNTAFYSPFGIKRYHLDKVTFSYSDHQKPTATSVISFSDRQKVITVVVEIQQDTHNKACRESKQLAEKYLSMEAYSWSDGLKALTSAVLLVSAYAMYQITQACCSSK